VHTELTLEILPQPTDETCGPACLHAVYSFFGQKLALDRVVDEVTRLGTGGTLAAYLGTHALARGYRATIYTYNLELFDPTWFEDPEPRLSERLREQAEEKSSKKRLRVATEAHLEYLEAGGTVRFEELTPDLIRRILSAGHPIMTGLSATYLYGCAREIYHDGRAQYDSIRGFPTGHFVVLHGYEATTDSVLVADPYPDNPLAGGHNYRVGIVRLLGAIMLGVLSYDGNLLVLEPTREPGDGA
jgi:hypothetical protein